MQFQFSILHKSADSVAPAFCAFSPACAAHLFPPRPQRAPLAALRLFRVGEELASSRDPPGGGCQPSRISPPSSSGDGPALLCSFSVPLFCEPLAVCSGRLIFSLAIPQFKRATSNCSQGLPAGPYPKQCRRLLSVSPPLAGGGCGRLESFSAGSCF